MKKPFEQFYKNTTFAKDASLYLNRYINKKEVVILCIGTDRSTGDALGPLVGTFLSESRLPEHITVYGTLENPVHALNLEEKLGEIETKHPDAFVMAIDACLSSKRKRIGHIIIEEEPLLPGASVHKNLPPVGDVSISGIVNISGFMEYEVLQATRLSLVMEMAKRISAGLKGSFEYCEKEALRKKERKLLFL